MVWCMVSNEACVESGRKIILPTRGQDITDLGVFCEKEEYQVVPLVATGGVRRTMPSKEQERGADDEEWRDDCRLGVAEALKRVGVPCCMVSSVELLSSRVSIATCAVSGLRTPLLTNIRSSLTVRPLLPLATRLSTLLKGMRTGGGVIGQSRSAVDSSYRDGKGNEPLVRLCSNESNEDRRDTKDKEAWRTTRAVGQKFLRKLVATMK